MALTRVKVQKINGKLEIIEKQTGIHDDNPVIYYGNEDQPIEPHDNIKPIAHGIDEFQEYLKKNNRVTKKVLLKDGVHSSNHKPTRKVKKQTVKKAHHTL
jgi:hypothetical protein